MKKKVTSFHSSGAGVKPCNGAITPSQFIFTMNKEEFDMLLELEIQRHKNRMEEIEAEKKAKMESELYKHNKELERQRIKGAEVRKSQERSRLYGR